MGSSKRAKSKSVGPGPAAGNHAKERHKRDRRGHLSDRNRTPPPSLKDLKGELPKPKILSKYRTYFELVENADKKKKLDFEFYNDPHPPPLFEFVPIGNPALADKCKEISRERDAMLYIVAPRYNGDPKQLEVHIQRIGYHFRQAIVQEARQQLPQSEVQPVDVDLIPGAPEPIPETQAEINEQADRHMRELFPRIPNTDRQIIIDHSFDLSKKNDFVCPVGLAANLPLTSRVQLAVLAHIRHTHTRYDELLRTYNDKPMARKIVQPVCLDILVKWRGDEESGRDQLDEILREVIVISDSESDEEEDEDDDDDSDSEDELTEPRSPLGSPGDDVDVEGDLSKPSVIPDHQKTKAAPLNLPKEGTSRRQLRGPRKVKKKKAKRKGKKDQRGLARYHAAWEKAREERQGRGTDQQTPTSPPAVMSRSASDGSRRLQYAPYPAYHDRERSATFREFLRYDETSPERLATGYRQQGPFIDAARFYDEAKPIVGSPVIYGAGIPMRRVRHQGEDLKDYPVKSTEKRSPDVSSFPSRLHDHSPWEQHRIRSAPEVQYGRSRQATSIIPGLRDYPDYRDLGLRDQVLSETGFSSQSIVPVGSQPRGFVRTFTPPGVTAAVPGPPQPGYHSSSPTIRAGSRLRQEPEVIWVSDDSDGDALLRTKARPIVIQDEYGHAQQVMVDSRPPRALESVAQARHSDSNRLDAYHARGEQRVTGPVGTDLPQDFCEIVRVSNKFPRRHEPQYLPPDAGGYATGPLGVIHYKQEDARDESGVLLSHVVPHPRAERVVGIMEEPLRQYPSQPEVLRPQGSIQVGVQRRERVVGLEYVQAAAYGRGARRFTSPILKMEAGEGGHWPRPGSATPMNPHPNHRVASARDYRREDGVIELN